MKTFNFNRPYEELSFNEILSVILAVSDVIDIVKSDKNNEISYNVLAVRDIRDFEDMDIYYNESFLNTLSFSWKVSIENENVDFLEKQDKATIAYLDSYFGSAINLGLIELK